MTIYIKSEENGWEVERQIDLPDDEKLVRSIMRSIKNRMASPKAAGGGIEPKAPEDKPEEKRQPDVQEGGASEEAGYRGFLMVKCEGCGKVHAFNAKTETTQFTCRECGHTTPLVSMAKILFECPRCGRHWTYQTNLEDAGVTNRCLECGTPMVAWWDKKLKKYHT